MRLLLINLLATTLLLIGASSASAVTINATSNYDGVTVLGVSDTITITVRLDTGPQLGIQLLGIGMQFDPTILQYDDAASSMSSYLLYAGPGAMSNPPASWLTPAPSMVNGGTFDFVGGLDSSPKLFPVPPFDQVNIDFIETSLAGTREITANAGGQFFGDLMATLVFHVIALGDGLGEVGLIMNSQNRVQLDDGTILDGSVVLNGSFGVITPEPTTALLVGLGLAGLGVAGRRSRA